MTDYVNNAANTQSAPGVWNTTAYSHTDAPQSAQSAVSWMQARGVFGSQPAVPNRIAELEAQIIAMGAVIRDLTGCVTKVTAERDYALLRLEVAIATSHAWIDTEVRRRIAKNVRAIAGFEDPPPDAQPSPLPCADPAPDPDAPTKAAPFPANALSHQSQAIGLLCTADSGRVRLGGYAPSLSAVVSSSVVRVQTKR